MSLRWPEAITRYQGCGRFPAAFFIFGVSLVSVTTRNEMADDLGDGPGTGIRQTSPITSAVLQSPSGMRRSQMGETDLFCKHPDVFSGVTGRSPDTGQARKKVFWRGGGEGRTQLLPTKGGLSLARRKTRVQTDASQFSRFSAGIKKGGSIAAPPKDDTWSKITLRRLPT